MPTTEIDLNDPIWTIRHVAAALDHLSVDSAREHTYRADFPAPRAPFASNLWLREEVLAWFAALPRKPKATGEDPARVRRSASGPPKPRTPRTTRAAPLASTPATPAGARKPKPYAPRRAA
ncbi:hypothetical protein [Nocardioides caldifontis]|uniref:hypothetical protein n=1 Tax=Nocardioides caldifontis TaxID=2588938 RepID=UPI0011E00512|nr:hypothetical protein [Nocardioides caldifontis]